MSEVAAPAPVTTPTNQNIPPPSPLVADKAAEQAEAPKAEAKESKPDTERFEMKVNGKVVHVNRSEAIRLAQLGHAATERFESAAQKEKKIDAILANAKKNPIAALQELGLSKEELRERLEEYYSREYIEPETLTEEQRKYKAMERELEERRAAEKEWKQKQQEEQDRVETDAARVTFEKQIIDAMETYKLAKTKRNLRAIAYNMKVNLDRGINAPMELIIDQVKREQKAEDAELSTYSYQDILERFGQEFINKIRAEDLKQLRDRRAKQGAPSFSELAKPATQTKITMREASAKLKAMIG
jgi:hypothetical protein